MRLVIGGFAQGKLNYVKETYKREKYREEACEDAGLFIYDENSLDELCRQLENAQTVNGDTKTIVLNHFHAMVKAYLQEGKDPAQLTELILRFEEAETTETAETTEATGRRNISLTVICDEVGNGVVPIDAFEREYREAVGRQLERIAKASKEVIRVYCGIGQVLKSSVDFDKQKNGAKLHEKDDKQESGADLHKQEIIMIRHGKTPANAEKRYLGLTEESLADEGIGELLEKKEQGLYPDCKLCFVSPMTRCLETAKLLYPEAVWVVIPQWKEMDFGIFEGKNYPELNGNEEYQKWVDSGCTTKIPGGESREEFIARTLEGYETVKEYLRGISKTSPVAFVVHGGTIMSLMSTFTKKDYFDFQIGCGEQVSIWKEF